LLAKPRWLIVAAHEWRYKMGWIGFLIIGIIAGWLAGQIMKGRGFGLLGNLVVGVVGAFLGGMLIGVFGFASRGGMIPSLVTATLGAVVLLWLAGVLKKA
jgi:uncharacterized membrane protein YeaQ/YmgE (transglycosylase-associated protein family)